MIPIITYHAVGDGPHPLWIPVREFEGHIEAFLRAGYRAISLEECARMLGGNSRPDDVVVLTFDDGYESVHSEAWPRLQRAGMTCTVFLVTDFCGRTNQWPGQAAAVPQARLVDWEHVRRMAEEGCEFGSHTRTHPKLTALSPAQVEDEVVASRDRIRAVTGQRANVFAYPYGETDPVATRIVSEHLDAAVGTRLGFARGGSDPYRLPRIDAYYLTPRLIATMRNPGFSAYLEFRQLLRTVRRRWS